ncbi:MAG: peptidoglycan-binding protein [Actinobacteria bacterium]|nr:peptidoglycan-binding protein [Actinomycetota bacterium]
MRLIARKDRGDEVADVQRRLAMLGYDIGVGGADGSFGEDTEKAVKRFQVDHALDATGVVTDETWRRLVESGYSLGDRLLYLRTPFFRGEDVKRLQVWLNKLGFNTGMVDGIFGQTTERAVREFQRNTGLVADGIVGDSTIAVFDKLHGILEDGASRVFPDPERASAISAIVGRPVAIMVGEGICAELAGRVGNLLEILGADVCFSSDKFAGAELLIGFEEFQAGEGPATVYESDKGFKEASRGLALSIKKELKTSLNCSEMNISPRLIGKGMPAAIIRPPLELDPCDPAGQEIYHQKIAVAVFDAVKAFLESAS